MFTGIIEDVGIVQKAYSSTLWVRTALVEVEKGDSLAVNGTCLTVTETAKSAKGVILSFDYSPETEQRTNIGELGTGSAVNLERALRVGDRFGGHIMTGHIEDKGRFVRKERKDNSWILCFSVNEQLKKYLVPKGSVAVDGISLTVVECGKDDFTVSVIPHTMKNTNFGSRKLGDHVNIEPDLLAKYVHRLISSDSSKTKITEGFLEENGFIN